MFVAKRKEKEVVFLSTAAQQINGRKGKTATLNGCLACVCVCPPHLNRSVLSLMADVTIDKLNT
jgi:hypothetical protein